MEDEKKRARVMLIYSIISTIVTLAATIASSYLIIENLLAKHYIILLLFPLGLGFMLAFAFCVLLTVDSWYEYQETKNL